MRSVNFALAAGLVLPLTIPLTKDRNPESAPVQQWALDLNTSPDVQNAGPIDANTRINLGHLGDNRLAVALLFPVRANGKFSPVRDQETWRAFLLILESSDGKILYSFRFNDFHGEGASSDWLQMGVINRDELLVLFGNELVRFSSDLKPLTKRTLPRDMKVRNGLHYYDHWRFLTDPAQNTALLNHLSLGGSADDHLVSTEDLADIEVAQLGNFQSSWSVLVGRQLFFSNVDLKAKKSTVMVVGAKDQPARPLCDGAVLASFGDGLLFIRKRPAASHAVVNLQGQEIYERQSGLGSDTILAASGAAQEDRVAFVYGSLRASLSPGWSASDHIVVLDADLKREIDVPNPVDKGIHVGDETEIFNTPALALSPDGKTLAVATGAAIKLWALP